MFWSVSTSCFGFRNRMFQVLAVCHQAQHMNPSRSACLVELMSVSEQMFNFWNPWVEQTTVYSIYWTKYFTCCSFSKILKNTNYWIMSSLHRNICCSKMWYWHGQMSIWILKTILQFGFQNNVTLLNKFSEICCQVVW